MKTTEPDPHFPRLKSPPKTIANLYPHLAPHERAEAEYTLKRYVALVWRIYQRVRRRSSEESGKTEKLVNPKKFDENLFKR